MTLSNTTQTLQRLTRFYNAGFHTPLVDNALNKILKHQITRDETDLMEVKEHLTKFEAQYGMTSDLFWERYQTGQLSDDADYVEWNVFCKMQQRLEKRLAILRGDLSSD